MFLPTDTYEWMLKENGPIENLSAIGYIIGAVWLFILSARRHDKDYLWSGLIVLSLALRELDFHVRFTTMGIFKTRYYLSNKVPLPEKLLVTAIVLTMFVALVIFTIKHYKSFLNALTRGETWAYSIATAMLLAVLTKAFDRLNVEMSDFIFKYTEITTSKLLRISEEVLELGIPLLILQAIAIACTSPRSPENATSLRNR